MVQLFSLGILSDEAFAGIVEVVSQFLKVYHPLSVVFAAGFGPLDDRRQRVGTGPLPHDYAARAPAPRRFFLVLPSEVSPDAPPASSEPAEPSRSSAARRTARLVSISAGSSGCATGMGAAALGVWTFGVFMAGLKHKCAARACERRGGRIWFR